MGRGIRGLEPIFGKHAAHLAMSVPDALAHFKLQRQAHVRDAGFSEVGFEKHVLRLEVPVRYGRLFGDQLLVQVTHALSNGSQDREQLGVFHGVGSQEVSHRPYRVVLGHDPQLRDHVLAALVRADVLKDVGMLQAAEAINLLFSQPGLPVLE